MITFTIEKPKEVAFEIPNVDLGADAFDKGYEAGEKDGYLNGYEIGVTEGAEVGYKKGEQEGYNKGVAETEAKTFWTKYLGNCETMFKGAVFPENAELTFELPSTCYSVAEMFSGTKNLVSVKLTGARTDGYEYFTTSGAFRYNSHIKKIDLSECYFPLSNWYMTFTGCYALEEIIGELSDSRMYAANFQNTFSGCYKLREVRFAKDAIFKTIVISSSGELSDASTQSIIDGLADLTGQTAQTLTFHKDVGGRLTQAQKAAISAKNWTLVY